MTEREWINLAKRRIRRLLHRRRFASSRQLEKKISEAGPPDIRPEPIKISTAIQELLHEGHILSEALPHLPTFYKPAAFGGAQDEARRQHILDLTTRFLHLTRRRQLCGKALERIVYQAATQTNRYTVLGTPDHPPAQGSAINGYVLERECDHILIPKDFAGPKLVVQDKNLREWLHPSAEEVWALIGKALRLPNAIPVLICRKMHYIGFAVFKHIGLACWQVYRQYFAPGVEADLEIIRHTDGLGFSDVTTAADPPAPLIRFFQQTVPNNIATFAARFEEYRGVLSYYAIDEHMEMEIDGARRSQLFKEFQEELPQPERLPDSLREDYLAQISMMKTISELPLSQSHTPPGPAKTTAAISQMVAPSPPFIG
jgi:hypothetical protein